MTVAPACALAVAHLLLGLNDSDADVRKAAVQALGKGAVRGDAAAVSLLAKRTKDSDEDVREAAVEAIAAVAHCSDADAVVVVLACIDDEDAYVRRAAAKAAGTLCQPGDREAVGALVSRLVDEDREVRDAVLGALDQLADGAMAPFAVELVLPLVEDGSNTAARTAGVRALRRVAARGNVVALTAAARCLQDGDAVVRCAAARTVCELVIESNHDIAGQLRRVIETDADEDVREEALNALAAAAQRADRCSLAAAAACLVDAAEDVRQAASRAVGAIAARRADAAGQLYALAGPLLDHTEEGVRLAIVCALASAAVVGDEEVLAALTAKLHDGDVQVRVAALNAVCSVAQPGNSSAVSHILATLEVDDDDDVREAAAKAVAVVATKGNQKAVEGLSKALSDSDPSVRCASAASLGAVAQIGDVAIMDRLVVGMQDEDENVGGAATDALIFVAGDDTALALSLVTTLVAHTEADVRCRAAEGIARLATIGVDQGARETALLIPLLDDADDNVAEAAGDALAVLLAKTVALVAETSHTLPALQIVVERSKHQEVRNRLRALEIAAKMYQHVEAVLTLMSGLDDIVPDVRMAAVRLVSATVGVVDAQISSVIVNGCASRLESQHRHTHKAVVALVTEAWQGGSPEMAAAAQQRFEHREPAVRRAALECLAAAAAPCVGSAAAPAGATATDAARGAAALLEDPTESVRDAAVAALGVLAAGAARGPPRQRAALLEEAYAAVGPRLQHELEDVRAAAAEAIAAVAERGDQEALGLLLGAAHDTDEDVRWAAVKAIGQVAARGDGRALQVVLRSALDTDEQVRCAAAVALGAVAERGSAEAQAALRQLLGDGVDVARAATKAMLALCPDAPYQGGASRGGRHEH